MSEGLSTNIEQGGELDSIAKMHEIIDKFFPDDAGFFAEFNDEEELLWALFGSLSNIDEDAEGILVEYGLIEPSDGEMNGNPTD